MSRLRRIAAGQVSDGAAAGRASRGRAGAASTPAGFPLEQVPARPRAGSAILRAVGPSRFRPACRGAWLPDDNRNLLQPDRVLHMAAMR